MLLCILRPGRSPNLALLGLNKMAEQGATGVKFSNTGDVFTKGNLFTQGSEGLFPFHHSKQKQHSLLQAKRISWISFFILQCEKQGEQRKVSLYAVSLGESV